MLIKVVLKKCLGFSLLELTIVLVLLAVLFAGVLVPKNEQILKQQEQQNTQLFARIKQSLIGFFIANKSLPCPASATSGGEAAFSSGSTSVCFSQHGFLPFKTLGLQGAVSKDQLFLDAWEHPVRYNISDKDYNSNGSWDWITATDIVAASTLSRLVGNLKVCDKTDCSNIVYTQEAVVLVLSQGKLDKQSTLEAENSGEGTVTIDGRTFGMADDNTFIYLPQKNLTETSYFDDFLFWIAPVELYYYLVD